MRVGFIGTGSMGSLLIEAFIRSEALEPNQIIASNRTKNKVEQLATQFDGLHAAANNKEVIQHSDIIFLCVKPLEFRNIIDEIKPFVYPHQLLVSITSPVMIEQLESHLPCKIAKVIPSINNNALHGSTLCMLGKRMTVEDHLLLEHLLIQISTPVYIEEKNVRISSDISSCGPAFMALIIEKFIHAAVTETRISYEEASYLTQEMLLGTAKLLMQRGFTPETLQQKVAVPGGITAEGLQILHEKLDGVFNQLFQITHAKYEEDVEKLNSIF